MGGGEARALTEKDQLEQGREVESCLVSSGSRARFVREYLVNSWHQALSGQEENSWDVPWQLENPAALQAGPTGQYMAAPCIPTEWD